MVNYEKGKIYKIEAITGEGQVYVGSTTKDYLSQRFDSHRSGYKRYLKDLHTNKMTSFKLFDLYGLDGCQIVLIEEFPCKSKDELTVRESKYIRELDCVNKRIEDRSEEELREIHKKYHSNYYLDHRKYLPCDRCGSLESNKYITRHQASKYCIPIVNKTSTVLDI